MSLFRLGGMERAAGPLKEGEKKMKESCPYLLASLVAA